MIGDTNYGVLGFRGAAFAAITLENPVLATFEPHIALDGADFVFKVGDGVRAYNDLPALNGGGGGGYAGPIGWGYATAAVGTPEVITGGQEIVLDNWSFTNYEGVVGFLGGVGQFGWAYDNAGWYQITFHISAGFTVGALALPEILLLDLQTYDGMVMQHEIPLSASRGFAAPSGNRLIYGATAAVTTAVYHSPDETATPGEYQSAHQLDFRWKGDAVLTSSDGGPASGVCSMEITRIA